MFTRPFSLFVAGLALWGCRSRAPADPSKTSSKYVVSRSFGSTAGAQAIAIRLARKGGGVRVYRLPSLTELPDAVRGKLPAAGRAIGVNPEAAQLFMTTPTGILHSLDLETGRVDSMIPGVAIATLGPDQTLFVVDTNRRVTTVARRVRLNWPQPLVARPRELFGASDQRLLAVVPGDSAYPGTVRLITAAAGQPPSIRVLPLAGDVAATRWGDLVAVACDSGVLVADPMTRREPAFIHVEDHPRGLAFSPSGHRIYVARRTGAGLAVIDRYEREEVDGVALPTAVSMVRPDPLGRWVLARPTIGDSVWIVDLPFKRLVGSVATAWDAELPQMAPDGSLLVAQGKDLVAYRPDSLKESGRVAGGSGDLWLFTSWRPRAGFRAADAIAATTTPGDSTGPDGPLYVQVSTSQNEAWSTEMAQQLSRAGLTARVLPPRGPDDGYRVVVGPYASRDQAEAIGRKVGRPYFIYQPPR